MTIKAKNMTKALKSPAMKREAATVNKKNLSKVSGFLASAKFLLHFLYE